MMQGIDLSQVAWVLQTHPYDDHLLPLHVAARAAEWAAQGAVPMQWFGSAQAIARIMAMNPKSLPRIDLDVDVVTSNRKICLTTIDQWQELSFGPYRVQTVAANHDENVSPMLFAIEHRGCRIFYGSDTSTLPDETWPRLAELGWSFDVVIFDHNYGFVAPAGRTHLGSAGMLREVGIMQQCGLVSPSTRILGTHLGHHSHGAHSVESVRAGELGYELAWDGLVVDVS
jgi:hypothetical protein